MDFSNHFWVREKSFAKNKKRIRIVLQYQYSDQIKFTLDTFSSRVYWDKNKWQITQHPLSCSQSAADRTIFHCNQLLRNAYLSSVTINAFKSTSCTPFMLVFFVILIKSVVLSFLKCFFFSFSFKKPFLVKILIINRDA